MTKEQFIKKFNELRKERLDVNAIALFHTVTGISIPNSTKFIKSLWGCSDIDFFGSNIYSLLESSANDYDFTPVLKSGCSVYFFYIDEHAAAYALHKINNYKL